MLGAQLHGAARRALAATLLVTGAFATPAQAITTTLSSDAVKATPGAAVEVLRNNMVIGRGTTDTTTGRVGTGGVCWDGYTPEIRPVDTVRVPAGDSMVVQDLSIATVTPDPTASQVTGRAPDLASLTVTLGGTSSTAVTGAPAWTAAFPGGTSGTAFATFTGPDGGFTTFASPAGTTGCPGPSVNAVANVNPEHVVNGTALINVANDATPLTLSGPGSGAPTLTLGPPAGTPGFSLSTGVDATTGTWAHTFTDFAALPEGELDATMGGTRLTILKDTVAPGPPTSTPPPGRYLTPPSISLVAPETGAVVHYTTDGSTPTAASPVYQAPIKVTAAETIRAFAVDTADNSGPTVALQYLIGPQGGGGGQPVPGVNPPADGTTPGGGNGTPTPRITALTVARRVSLSRLRRAGLPTSVGLGTGTTAVRFTIYQRAVVKRHRRLRLVASIVRVPGHAGTYKAKLDARALGLTRIGLFQLKIVPGLSRSTLDQSAARTVWIRVVR